MPLTTLMTLVGSIVMLGSWAFIARRIKRSTIPISQQVRFLQSFFLCMGVFCFIIFLPHLLLGHSYNDFSIAIAWAYVIGHVSFYIAMINIQRLTVSMVPRLASKEKIFIICSSIIAAAITVINIITMPLGTLPTHDFARHVTFFNAAPVVGVAIALFALVSVLPAATLMVMNGIRNPASRTRSFLLGGGLIMMMTAGPLHDVAQTWQLYMVADIVSMLGLVVVAAGVAYRLDERIGHTVALPTGRR